MKRFAAVIIISYFVATISQANLILSTTTTETLGGFEMRNGDLVSYDPVTNRSTLFFSESLFRADEDIDAVSILGNGNIILSTTNNAILGGLSFKGGDLVEYNPLTNIASLFFNGSLLGNNKNIDAAYVRGNGNIILSTTSTVSLGGVSFHKDDLAEYNPTTMTASMFFDGSSYFDNSDENIDAAYIFDNGNLLLSTSNNATLGGLNFRSGDIVEFNPLTNTASIYFNQDLMNCYEENIDAVFMLNASVPEPATGVLLVIGALMFARKRTSN